MASHEIGELDGKSRTLKVGVFTFVERNYAPRLTQSRHAHSTAKMSLVISGGVSELTSKGETDAGPGDLVVKPRGFEHADRFAAHGTRMFSVYFSAEDHEMMPDWARLVKGYRWLASPGVARQGFATYQAFRRAVATEVPAADERVLELLGVIDQTRTGHLPQSGVSKLVDRARELIHSHVGGTLLVQDIARSIGAHPVYLTRVFRSRLGLSLSEYIQRVRVQKAASMLSFGEMPAAEVAIEAGFADQAHSCRMIKRWFGLTPVTYRRMTQGGADS